MEQGGFDFDKEYGIVLEGGGAKGAYQIGVWKALLEYGVKINAVAGVSVGALNGALICMGDYEKAVDIWKNISYSSIMNVDDDEMDKLVNKRFKDINIQTVREQSRNFLVSGGLDVTPLKQLLDEHVDEKKIRESEIEFYMGTFNVSNLKEFEISAKEAEDGYLKDYLMASANFPLFKSNKLNGKTYLDGGITNNVPIDMLIRRGYKNIIVIRIYGIGMEKRIKIPEDANLIYIAPRQNLCNVLEFNRKKAARNIMLGYYDAVRILKPLAGNEYYIDSVRSPLSYLEALTALSEEELRPLLMLSKQELKTGFYLRKCMEDAYPQLAIALKLSKNWSYADLYYAILEYCAKKLHIKKYKIYSEQEFLELLYAGITRYYEEQVKQDNLMDLALCIIKNNLS